MAETKKIAFDFDEEYLQLLTKAWQKFFKRFAEVETLPVSEWKHVHLLAHFADRFAQHYKKKFAFSVKGAPSKSTEVYMIKRISGMLGTTNPRLVKTYIDWIFDNKIIGTSKKIRSLGFLANTKFCNEFHLAWTEMNKIKRTTQLPENYRNIAKELSIPVRTFGDLEFAKQIVDSDPEDEETQIYHTLFHELYKVGFEFDMLKELK